MRKRINKHKDWRAFVFFVSRGRKCRKDIETFFNACSRPENWPGGFLSLPPSPLSLSIRRCDIYPVVVEGRRKGGRGWREGGCHCEWRWRNMKVEGCGRLYRMAIISNHFDCSPRPPSSPPVLLSPPLLLPSSPHLPSFPSSLSLTPLSFPLVL